jgi:hypothetical protein
VKACLNAFARLTIFVSCAFFYAHIHLTSVYYPGSPRTPDTTHVVPVSYKGGTIYVLAAQQGWIDLAFYGGLCLAFAAVGLTEIALLLERMDGNRQGGN